MECHDVHQLLAFTQRPCEAIDGAEREAVSQHLRGCAECAAFARNERALNDALGTVMRAVTVPADLKPKLMKRLAASRGARRWQWPTAVAAAAALLLAVGLGCYFHWVRAQITAEDLASVLIEERWTAERASQYFHEQGLSVLLPPGFEYSYLQTVEIVPLKGHRVAKVGFSRTDQDGTASAIVLILPNHQFRTEGIAETTAQGWEVQLDRRGEFSYLIFFRGQLNLLRPIGA